MSSAAGQSVGASRPRSSSSSSSSSSTSARPSSAAGALTPARDADLNRPRSQGRPSRPDPASAGSGSAKRKRDLPPLAADSLLQAPIVLKPHPSDLTVKPRMLHPLMLLPREHLPLSALDLSRPHGDLPASRLFESRIKILDLEGRLGSSVLLARSETSRMVYAVEQESSGLYALCKLGSWVDIDALGQSATVVCRDRLRADKPAKPESASDVPLTTPLLYQESKRRKLAIEGIQSLVRKRAESVAERQQQGQAAAAATEERPPSRAAVGESPAAADERAEPAAQPQQPPQAPSGEQNAEVPDGAPGDDAPAQPSADDVFQNIRAQYFEALYHSRGSLAYFAKGPLSRARAAFNPDSESNLDMDDLVDFLKSLVITTVLIDKKYRETIPEIVARMKTLVDESEDGTAKPRKKKAKKPKLGKDGLYPGEVAHIRRWWAAHQRVPTGQDDDDKDLTPTETKYHISCLRRRETQLQMILILEILALESRAQPKEPAEESRASPRESSQEPPIKKRNKHNLPVLLDVHADRLCIWQSTTLDEVKAVAESQMPVGGQGAEKPDRANSDPLRDFCVDVIVPFFSARLPGPCDSLNRKLGGPIALSPPREKVKKKPAVAAKPKPGAPAKRATASRRDSDRTLERALSVERSRRSVSRGPAGAIALMRSASNPVIPGLKREASEPSLMGLASRTESGGSLKERPASIFSRSASSAGAEDRKAKQKAQVEAELKDAISALKKPNRTLAVKELVEAAEKRASAGQLRKLKKPSRSSTVQVKATPVNNRYKDALATETSQSQPAQTPMDVPPSSASVVPSSNLPRKFANRLPNAAADRVQATPVRAKPLFLSLPQGHQQQHQAEAHTPGIPASSPLMARKAAAPGLFASAAARPRPQHSSLSGSGAAGSRHSHFTSGGGIDLPSSPGLAALFETPVAPRSSSAAAAAASSLAKRDSLAAAGAGAGDADGIVDGTPIRSRVLFPASGNGGGNRAGKEREKGVVGLGEIGDEENGSGLGSGLLGLGVKREEMSIYKRLGWDDEDELDDI